MNYGRVLDAKKELEKLGPQPDDVLDAFDISTIRFICIYFQKFYLSTSFSIHSKLLSGSGITN